MLREDVEYICEIAFCIGVNNYKEDMDNILAEYTALDFDYECYVDFYKYVLDIAYTTFGHISASLLENIYDIVNDKNKLLGCRDNFLYSYKK